MSHRRESTGRRVLALIGAALAGAILTVGVGAAAWIFTRPDVTAVKLTELGGATSTPKPADSTTAPSSPVTPALGTGSTATTQAASASAVSVAFRLGATLYVAGAGGEEARAIVLLDAGADPATPVAYALSPDGASVAVVDANTLTVYDTASAAAHEVGPADAGMVPSWAPDSSAFVFRRRRSGGSFALWRCERDGSGARFVRIGEAGALSEHGSSVSVVTVGRCLVSHAGDSWEQLAAPSGTPSAVALRGRWVYIASADGAGHVSVARLKTDSSQASTTRFALPAGAGAAPHRIVLASGSERAALDCTGDDGYARTYIIDFEERTAIALSTRRDTTLSGWAPDGSRAFVIDGNAFQGQSTVLASFGFLGDDRRILVTGAF